MEEEQVELILNNQGDSFTVFVDLATANELLNDPLKADQYVEKLKKQKPRATSSTFVDVEPIAGPSSCSEGGNAREISCGTSYKIWSQKRPTERDVEATEIFLKLRQKYSSKFDDRKTIKSQLWQKIGEEMCEMGFYVGEGKEAIEKLRLKFSNLQKSYLSHVKHINTTGESQKDPPPFFDLMHDILGGKDKSNPTNLQDTLSDDAAGQCDDEASDQSQEENRESIKNRFKQSQYQRESQTQKPKSTNLRLLELAISESEDRKQHMSKLENLLEKQNTQRDVLIEKFDKMINVMSRKRKRDSSESE